MISFLGLEGHIESTLGLSSARRRYLTLVFILVLTAVSPAVFPVLAKSLRHLPAGIKSISFHIHLKRAIVSLFFFLKTNM